MVKRDTCSHKNSIPTNLQICKFGCYLYLGTFKNRQGLAIIRILLLCFTPWHISARNDSLSVRNINIDRSGCRSGIVGHKSQSHFSEFFLLHWFQLDLFEKRKREEWESLTHICQTRPMKTRLSLIKEKREIIDWFVLGIAKLAKLYFYLKKRRRIHILHQISQKWVHHRIQLQEVATIPATQFRRAILLTIPSLRVNIISLKIRSTTMIPLICRMMLSYLPTSGLQVRIKIYKNKIFLRYYFFLSID